jgi:hypothetical protein
LTCRAKSNMAGDNFTLANTEGAIDDAVKATPNPRVVDQMRKAISSDRCANHWRAMKVSLPWEVSLQ